MSSKGIIDLHFLLDRLKPILNEVVYVYVPISLDAELILHDRLLG